MPGSWCPFCLIHNLFKKKKEALQPSSLVGNYKWFLNFVSAQGSFKIFQIGPKH